MLSIPQNNHVGKPPLTIPERLKELQDGKRALPVEQKEQPHNPALEGSMAELASLVDGVRWLVKGWIPCGMLSGTIAEPKIGKSAWALWALVRPLITGCTWFNGAAGGPAENVLWCDTEGSAGINLERMRAWGLPLERVKMPFPQEPLKRVDLNDAEHILQIERMIKYHRIRFVQVDSYRGAHKEDENNSRSVSGLQNLSSLAEQTGTAIHLIHHTHKLKPGEELTGNNARGSNVFLAMVRTLIGIDIPDGTGGKNPWRRVRVLLENFGNAPAPLGYRFKETGLEIGAAPEPVKRAAASVDAKEWLVQVLKNGPVLATELLEQSQAELISERTLRRAKKEAGVVARKAGHTGNWLWQLPD